VLGGQLKIGNTANVSVENNEIVIKAETIQ